jgi:hypothetical protein
MKMLKTAAALVLISAPAFAANLENPLYLPKTGEFYSKTGAGAMFKITDGSDAMVAKDHAYAQEWPVLRFNENLGYGITDRLTVRGTFGWTQDDAINRKGMHEGRLGLDYRLFDGTQTDGFVWDVYADAFLGGISAMKAELIKSPHFTAAYPLSFNYDNYANGRWGAWLGTQVGKTWGNFTGAAFVELERTFGNNNNEIAISSTAKGVVNGMIQQKIAQTPLAPLASTIANAYVAGLPSSFSVDTKATWEYSAGLKGFYEYDADWSFGGGLTYKHRSANTIEAVNLKVDVDSTLPAAALANGVNSASLTKGIADNFIGGLKDGWDEYILAAAVSRQINETLQVSLYGEYTFDSADAKSQNGTDVKAEVGVRVNVAF